MENLTLNGIDATLISRQVDHEMFQLTTIGRKPSLGLIVHHTDAERE